MTEEEKLVAREEITLRAMFLDQSDPEAIDRFDQMVCEAIGVDKDAHPPHFIFDAINSA